MDDLTKKQEYITNSDSSSPEQNARSCKCRELEKTQAELAKSRQEVALLRDTRNTHPLQLIINELDDKVGHLKQIVKKQELDKHYHNKYMCQRNQEIKEKTKQYNDLLVAVRKVANGDGELKRTLKELGVDFGEGGSAASMKRVDSKWDNQS